MGWALKNLDVQARERIARNLFTADDALDESGNGRWLVGLCPLHEDKQNSFSYNIDNDVFHCFAGCTNDGDLVALWCLCNGYEGASSDGFRAFKRLFGADAGVTSKQAPGVARLANKPAEAKSQKRERIPQQVMDAQGPIPDAMLQEMRMRRGWAKETLLDLGVRVLTHYRKKSDLYSLFAISARDRVAIPIYDDNGDLWNIRTYYPFGKPEEAPAKIMSWGKGHGAARLFPAPAKLRPGPVVLCEGESDCICARSYGLNAISQTGKPNAWDKAHVQALAGREIIIAYDADGAGKEYALRAAKNLTPAGCAVRIIQWPAFMCLPDGTYPEDHGQDLTDFFVKHGKTVDDFLALVAAAPLEGGPPCPPAPDALNGAPWLQFFKMGASGRYSFSERFLADHLMRENTMLYHDKSGCLYRFDGTHFEAWSTEQLKRAAIESLGEEATSSRVNASSSLVMSMVSMPQNRDINDMGEWVCLQNGMFNLFTLELEPHTPDYMATIKLGVSWHGEKAPKPERFLHYLNQTVQTPEVIAQVQEFMGYCLTRQTKFGKALLLLGPGSDGKSKFISILRALVGPANCSAVSMSGLDDQFQRVALFNKVLNVGTEITTEAIQSEMFKAIVTGDPIQASFKHRDSFEFTPYCKLVYATNKIPRVLDNSDGYFRRLLPIQFKRQFLEGDKDLDTDLEEKLLAELDGIFAWAVMGLHRLIQQKGFTQCDETLEFMMRYRRYNNPVMAFLQDRCSLEKSDHETQIKDLYKAYKDYCSEGGYRPANRENFFEEMQTASRKLREDAAIHRSRPRRQGQRPDLVVGVMLLPQASEVTL